MVKFIAISLTALICSQAYAGWTATPYASGHDGTYYWDPEHIQFSGSQLNIWIADDYGEAQISKMKPGAKYFSLKEKLEVDCNTAKSRVVDYIELSGHLGDGSIVFQEKREANWIAIESDSISQRVMTAFCKKAGP